MKLDQLLTPDTRINSKCIKDLHVRHEPIKILEENMGSKISDIACSNTLSDTSQARETKEIHKQMGLHQTKNFLHSKGNHEQNRDNPWNDTGRNGMGEYICQSDKELISNIYKKLIHHLFTLLDTEDQHR